MRYALLVLLFLTPLTAQEIRGGPGADPARFFPADTFLFVEADAGAVGDCLPEWQIAKVLTDPALKPLLKPALEKLGLDPEKPVESILKLIQPGALFEGRAAFGVRGGAAVIRDANGKEWRFRVSPEAPLDAATVFRLIGMGIALDGPAGRQVTFEMDVDFLAVGKPGPLGMELVGKALANMEGEVTRRQVKILGLDATHVHVTAPIFDGLSYAFNLYAAERDGTWFLASQTDTLEQALQGGPRVSLATSASLAQARARFTSGRPLLFGYADLACLLGAYKALVPPVAGEMGDIAGINALRGVGFGISLVDGGVRESLGILLDGNPRGFWKILDAMPPGLRSLEVAPPGALAAMAVKIDLTLFRDRLRAFLETVVPGNADQIEHEIVRECQPFDVVKEVLPALGDELAVLVYPAGPNEMFPRFVLGIDGRDEEALTALVAKVQAMVPAAVASFTPVDLPEGIRAVRVALPAPYDVHYAIHKKHLFLASDGKLLGEVLTKWGGEGAQRLVRDDTVLPLVLKATNGGDTTNLAALAYVNLRGCGVEALKAMNLWGAQIPEGWYDPKALAEIRRIPNHLTGAAIALRHDKDGICLDCFSPVGVLFPAMAAAVLTLRQEVAIRQVAAAQRAGSGRPSLGITTKSCDGTGVKVLGLAAQGAAAAGGLQQGDKVVGIGGVVIATMEDLDRELSKRKPGDAVEVKVRRGDGEIIVTVELGEEERAGW
ncbi:MAG: PDZ domain-containing protein [Planctomycetota bacterium]